MESLKILVVDDKTENREEASEQFSSKNVEITCVDCFSVAASLLRKYSYDMLLTDLMLPGEAKGVVKNHPQVGQEIPYGLILAIMAKNYAVPDVAILTDATKDSGPILWAMDKVFGDNECISVYNHKKWLSAAEKFITLEERSGPWTKEGVKSLFLIAGNNDQYKNVLVEALKSDTSDFILIPNSENNEILSTFVEEKPDYVILLGELYREDTEHYIEDELNHILKLKTENQKVLVLGYMDSNSEHYLQIKDSPAEISTFFK